MSNSRRLYPFDGILLLAYGGPRGREEIRPFLQQVVHDRPVPPVRLEEVAQHYEVFDGLSPITELTYRQAEGLAKRLRKNGMALPVYVGMRNWHPFIKDSLSEMAKVGIGQAIGFILAPHQSYPSCGQYKEAVTKARNELAQSGYPDIQMTYVDRWYDHQWFIEAHVQRIQQALEKLNSDLRGEIRLIFTAHSIPEAMAKVCKYRDQLMISCLLIAEKLQCDDWALVFQSRSGRPQDPWLEPDICDYLRAEHAKGLKGAVIAPIGFVCDHIELLYDLDIQSVNLCRQLNLPMVRAESLNDHPLFIDMMADIVHQTCEYYHDSLPLPIVAS